MDLPLFHEVLSYILNVRVVVFGICRIHKVQFQSIPFFKFKKAIFGFCRILLFYYPKYPPVYILYPWMAIVSLVVQTVQTYLIVAVFIYEANRRT
jgi:hypothetical protein